MGITRRQILLLPSKSLISHHQQQQQQQHQQQQKRTKEIGKLAAITHSVCFVSAITVIVCLVASVHIVAVNGLANCPFGCECDDETLVVKCGEGTLDVLPIALNPSIQRLIIKKNKIKTIDSSIYFYAELSYLDLSYNDLVTIPQRTFNFQKKLQELHLNHNKIGQINNKTFIGLNSVTVLNLCGNLLAELERGTFSPMIKIEELNLGQNRISHIDQHAFDGLTNLRILYLDDNTLTTMPVPATFLPTPSLAELYLGTNSFLTIPDDSFKNLIGLTRLDLRGAGLHNISAGALKGLEGLRFLELADNRLQKIPTNAFEILERLEQLSMGQNDFEVIGPGAFGKLKNLRRLEIIGAQMLCRVESGAFTNNANLEYLNLSSNKMLNEIQENAFSGLPNLRHIVLNENQLSTLSKNLVHWNDLQTLDLSDNPINCDCDMLWLQNLFFLKNATKDRISNVVCAAPEHLRGESLSQLPPNLLGCSHSGTKNQAMIGIVIVVIAASVTAFALLIYGYRRRLRKLFRGDWSDSALGRKEREYQKTFSDEEYMTRQQQHACHLSIHPPTLYANSNYNPTQTQYVGIRPIPVTEL